MNKDYMKFNKGRVLHLGWDSPVQEYTLGYDWIESIFVGKKNLGVLLDNE